MRISVIFLLIIGLQTAESQTLPFLINVNGQSGSATVGNYKYAVANKVFQNLLNVRGETSLPAPKLTMSHGDRFASWFRLAPAEIGLEEKAYDICSGFGADSLNALSLLLARELTHYYEKPDWDLYLSGESGKAAVTEQWNAATGPGGFPGGFLAFSAGYEVDGILPVLLKKLYGAYAPGDSVPGYEPLEKRLAQAEDAGKQYRELRLMSDLSRLLTILENYEDAAVYSRSISAACHSRDLHYDVSLKYFLAALHYFSPEELPYILPLELDFRARHAEKGLNAVDLHEKRKTLLRAAVVQADTAIRMDREFRPAYLAKGLALALIGASGKADSSAFRQADDCLREGLKHSPLPKMTTDFLVAQGIAAVLSGDTGGATRYWEQAKIIGSYLAVRNLDILQKKPPARISLAGPAPIAGVEQIEWYALDEFLSARSFDRELETPIGGRGERAVFHGGMKQKLQSQIFYHSAEPGRYTLVQETGPGYRGNSLRGVNLSSKADNVQEAYGVAKRNFAMPGGFVWVYPEVNLYFNFNTRSDLLSWGVFRIK